jgi:hypothetical protein
MTRTVQIQHCILGLLAAVLLVRDDAFSQQAAPQSKQAPQAPIVRVRIGYSSNTCQGYCSSQTTVEAGWYRSITKASSDKKHYPDMKSEWRITNEDWGDLQRFLDAKILAAFTGTRGCPGCADEFVEYAEVQFADGTKKAVSFNRGAGPPEIAALFEKVQNLAAKPPVISKGKSAAGSPHP